ncbi:MAG: cadmium-translocating P-type ATPase, partial [Clostridia bacterium]|nr:cadmium-translocating P-type ATPase [Clostridia bacterium]
GYDYSDKKSIKQTFSGILQKFKKDHDHEHHHEHSHEHHHDHDHGEDNKLFKYALIASAVMFVLSFIKIKNAPELAYSIALALATILAAFPIIMTAVKNIIKGDVDENVLMTISVVSACLLGDFREAAAVAIFFRLGEAMEDYASKRSRDSIRSLSEIQVDTANVLNADNSVAKVEAKDVEIGTNIAIYPHERFPLDCVITHGAAYVDASAITGESVPVAVEQGSTVYSGTLNGSETLFAKTTKRLEESTASRIIKMVEEASEKKSKTQRLISKIAAYYTPAVVILALIVALVPSIITKDWGTWIRRALVLLVASCPCALVLSVPLGFFTSMGAAARKGILIKGSKYIEETAKAKCVAFDKTGTLTTDELSVDEVISPIGLDPQIVLLLAAIAESRSNHPIAKAIRLSAPEFDAGGAVTNEEEYPGLGSSVVFAGKKIICGRKKLLESNGIYTGDNDGILVAVDNDLIGIIKVKAAVRDDTEETIKALREAGIGRIVMLTGDNEEAAKQIAKEIDIDEYHAKLMPDDKLRYVEELKQTFGGVIFVGDGINDAPVLAAADVGVGMGLGTHAANDASDIVLTTNNLIKLAQARLLAAKTMNVLKANITLILAVKLIVIVLGIFGIAPMWLAVFADVGLCVIAVLISATIASDNINEIISSLFKKKK